MAFGFYGFDIKQNFLPQAFGPRTIIGQILATLKIKINTWTIKNINKDKNNIEKNHSKTLQNTNHEQRTKSKKTKNHTIHKNHKAIITNH